MKIMCKRKAQKNGIAHINFWLVQYLCKRACVKLQMNTFLFHCIHYYAVFSNSIIVEKGSVSSHFFHWLVAVQPAT